MKQTSSKHIIIKNSRIHQKGVFARTSISKGNKVLQYLGERVSKKEGTKRAEIQHRKSLKRNKGSVFVFELNHKYDIDGSFSYNKAKCINHSCGPNCRYKLINGKIWIISIRDINKGEELTYNYNFDLEDWKNCVCKCNSKNCLGYMVGPRYRAALAKILRK